MYDLTPDTTAERLRQLAHFVEGLPHGTKVISTEAGLTANRIHLDYESFIGLFAGKACDVNNGMISIMDGEFKVVTVVPKKPSDRTCVVPAKE